MLVIPKIKGQNYKLFDFQNVKSAKFIFESKIIYMMETQKAHISLGNQDYKTNILVGGHSITADEPVEVGGNNEGPTATQLLLSSLGSCTAITMRMYAQRKEWNLGDITIDLSIDRENVEGRMVSKILRSISFSEELSEEQKERMLLIADKCPIHKTLTGELSITTE